MGDIASWIQELRNPQPQAIPPRAASLQLSTVEERRRGRQGPREPRRQRRGGSPDTSPFSGSASSSSSPGGYHPASRNGPRKRPHSGNSRRDNRARVKQRRSRSMSSLSWDHSSDSDASSGISEEGERSYEDLRVRKAKDRWFHAPHFPSLISKVRRELGRELKKGQETGAPDSAPKFAFLEDKQEEILIPSHKAFVQVLETEWSNPSRHKHPGKIFERFYSFDDEALMAKLATPVVDTAVAALSSSSVLPSQGEGGPRDPCDKRIESALRRNFEADACAYRASAANSLLARAAKLWLDELLKEDIPKHVKGKLKNVQRATAFLADSSLDAMRMNARGMAAGTVARRNLWLRDWEVDSGSKSRLTAVNFNGAKLFGEPLDKVLVETEDGQKALPSAKKEYRRKRYSF